MSWIEDTQKAIMYIEDNLLESVSAGKAANHIGYTSDYFQKMFLIITGFTVSEYIRNRRLSLAGRELAITKSKVIDVALKYGYETPESFAKAFVRFHGFVPSKAKAYRNQLRHFNPLKIEISITGGFDMSRRVLADGENAIEVAEHYYIEGYHGSGNNWLILDPTSEEIEGVLDKLSYPPDNFVILMPVRMIGKCAYIQAATETHNEKNDSLFYVLEAQLVYSPDDKTKTIEQKQYRKHTTDITELKQFFTAFAAGITPDIAGWDDVTTEVIPCREAVN